MAFNQPFRTGILNPRVGRAIKMIHYKRTGVWPLGPILLRGFGQYQAGDYSTDMWKGSIYDVSPVNTSNWLGTATNLLTDIVKVAGTVVPSILNYRLQKDVLSDQRRIEAQRLANEQLMAQKQAQYYDQIIAQSKANTSAATNQQAGITPYTPTVTTGGYIPSPATQYITSGGRESMYGGFAVEPAQIEDLKKYLPYAGFGLIILILLLRRPAAESVN